MYVYTENTAIRLTWIIMIIASVVNCGSITLSPPNKLPVSTSKIEKELLQQGGKHFKQGNFKPALNKAQEAFEFNPDNVEAMYAIATSYLALNELNRSLQFSKQAASYKSEYLPGIYLLMGNAYDRMDEHWNSLRTYRYAASKYPNNPEVQYELGRTYALLNKPELAAEAFKKSIRLAPGNPASHFELGILYYANGYTTPALLTLSTALLLDPMAGQAPFIRDNIFELFDSKAGETKKTDEGDFESVDTEIYRQRARLLKQTRNYSKIETATIRYQAFLKALEKTTNKNQKSTFTYEIYVPFYKKIIRQDLGETFVYYIFQGEQNKTITDWLKRHSSRVHQLEQLLKEYRVKN